MSTPITKHSQQPYTVKVSRQLADHTMIEVVFVEPQDDRATARVALICDAIDERLQATNRRILDDNAWVEAQRTAIRAEERELIRAEMLNEMRNQGLVTEAPHGNGSDRPALD